MGDRKKRKAPKKFDYMEVIDITTIGTKDDPCFGKLYDLSENTCRMCGDNARCAIVQSQNQLGDRKTVEKKNRFKDLETADKDEIKIYLTKLKNKDGLKRFEAVKKAIKKYGKEGKKTYQEIYKSI